MRQTFNLERKLFQGIFVLKTEFDMKHQIILNWLPPATVDMPSPAMTVLKGALGKAGFSCKISNLVYG